MFGYPDNICDRCRGLEKQCELRVKPHYRKGGGVKLMLIGQDPTVFVNNESVKSVLMLDDNNSQIARWLVSMFGDKFKQMTVYATNVVKCSFEQPPSTMKGGGYRFLQPYFANCQVHLRNEVVEFGPEVVITLGETAHRLFRTMLNDSSIVQDRMKDAFSGSFQRVSIGNTTFYYSPCLHIKTYRVAETYGDSVKAFKNRLGNL